MFEKNICFFHKKTQRKQQNTVRILTCFFTLCLVWSIRLWWMTQEGDGPEEHHSILMII